MFVINMAIMLEIVPTQKGDILVQKNIMDNIIDIAEGVEVDQKIITLIKKDPGEMIQIEADLQVEIIIGIMIEEEKFQIPGEKILLEVRAGV